MMESKVDDISKDLKALSKDTKDLAREAKSQALEKTGELSKKYVEFLDSAIAAAKEVPTVAVKKTKEIASTTDDYVTHNPWRAVTISAGLGLVLGFLFSRK
ncbi:hypothetical protein D3C87_137590 [compost metagenome]|jgi:ElaB/YqjD/DUF883 family membrane-anchored ribosome-binding protein